MSSNSLINYHPTDADADLIVKYIVKNVDDYIDLLAVRPSSWSKIIREYKDQEGMSFDECCKTDLEEIFADEWQGSLEDTIVTPSEEGAWGKAKEMSLNEYLDKRADRIYNHMTSAGFINHWIDDLIDYNAPSFAGLMVKVNIRLAVVLDSSKFTIRNELISRVYYHLHNIVERYIRNYS